MPSKKSATALQKKIDRVEALLSTFEERNESHAAKLKKLDMLDSVTGGLYDEIEKLTKKAPGATVTDLCLEQVNDVIGETRKLADVDEYVQKLSEFIPAGDNPPYQDVLFVMRQVREGITRYRDYLNVELPSKYIQSISCKAILCGLRYELEEGEVADQDYMNAAPDWALAGDYLSGKYLNHDLFKGDFLERSLGIE